LAARAPLGTTDEGKGPGHDGTLPSKLGRAGRPRGRGPRRCRSDRSGPVCHPWIASHAMTITRLGIVGSGIMGSGIAEVAAKAGVEVVLRSRKQATADAMVAGLEKSLAKQVERGKLEEAAAKEIAGRVTATDHLGN